MKNVVKNQATRGIFWTLVETFLTKGVALIIQIILARLLLPSDFGVIAMITVVIAVSQALVEGGFQNALIREENPSEDDFTTVFYTNLFFSIILYIILFFLSPIIAEIYTNNQLVPVIRVTALGLVFNAFTIVQRTKYTRDMNFKIQTKVAVLSSIISGIIAITIASLGWGYWSLVIQNIVLQSMTMILFILSSKWIPRGTFSKESFVKLFNFGWKLSVSSLINTIYDNVYYLIIGRNFSASAVGYYTNAQKLRDVVSQSITSSIQRVSYPMLSKLQNDNEVLKTSYKKIVKYSSLVVFAIMAGLAAIAPVLFIILFGDKWTNSIAIFQVLALAGILYPLSAINLNILQVKGRSDLFLRIELFKKVIGFLLIALGIFFKVSVIGFAWISVFISVISLGINLVYTEKLIEYSGIEQVKDIFPYAISSIIMFFCVNHFEHNILDSNILLLLSKILLGMLIYVALIWFLSKEDRTLIKKIFDRRKTNYAKRK